MSQFLIDFVIDNLFFVLCITAIMCGIAFTSKILRKLFSKVLILGCIYLGLVGLYKLGVGNTILYEWSIKIIYSICLFVEQTLGSLTIFESIILKIFGILEMYGYDGYSILLECSKYAEDYVIPYVRDIHTFSVNGEKKIFSDLYSYSNEDYLILKIKPNYLTPVLRC